MDELRAMRTFATVVERGGFAAAARALDVAPAVVTRLVAELEDHLGARLLNRTTRRMALTDIGERYLERVRQVLTEVEEARALAQEVAEPRGLVRVRMPPAFAVHQFARQLPAFLSAHPLVQLELHADRPVDAVDDALDLTIFIPFTPPQGDFVARPLASSDIVMCASPGYLASHAEPRRPVDLKHHAILVPMRNDLGHQIVFERIGRDGRESVPLQMRQALLRTASAETLLAAAMAGLGVVGLPSMIVGEALGDGRLVRVLSRWRLFSIEVWVGYPSRKHVPARTRALLDFLVSTFGGRHTDPWVLARGAVGA